MTTVIRRVRTALSNIRKLVASRAVAVVFAVLAGSTLAAAPAYAVTIDFSTSVVPGFTFTGLNLDNSANCPVAAPCDHINNAGATLTITSTGAPFDFNSFWYEFVGNGGNLVVTSDLSGALNAITIAFADKNSHMYSIAGSLAGYFQGITWLKFSSDTQANVRIDDIGLSVVPVPAGIALGAASLGMLGLLGWRRKKTIAA